MRLVSKDIQIHLGGLTEHKRVNPKNLFLLETQLKKELSKIFCNLANAGEHNHAYLVINNTTGKKLTGKTTNNAWVDGKLVKAPTHPGSYLAITMAEAGKWEKELHNF